VGSGAIWRIVAGGSSTSPWKVPRPQVRAMDAVEPRSRGLRTSVNWPGHVFRSRSPPWASTDAPSETEGFAIVVK